MCVCVFWLVAPSCGATPFLGLYSGLACQVRPCRRSGGGGDHREGYAALAARQLSGRHVGGQGKHGPIFSLTSFAFSITVNVFCQRRAVSLKAALTKNKEKRLKTKTLFFVSTNEARPSYGRWYLREDCAQQNWWVKQIPWPF